MTSSLLAFAPISAIPLIIVIIGLLIIVGAVRRRRAGGWLGILLLGVIATPFVESAIVGLPLWILALIILSAFVWLARVALTFALGEHAAGHVIGTAFVGLVKLVFLLLLLPFRLLSRSLGGHR